MCVCVCVCLLVCCCCLLAACVQRLEHWKETDEWYPIVNNSSNHNGKAKMRVQCCRVPNSIAAARSALCSVSAASYVLTRGGIATADTACSGV